MPWRGFGFGAKSSGFKVLRRAPATMIGQGPSGPRGEEGRLACASIPH